MKDRSAFSARRWTIRILVATATFCFWPWADPPRVLGAAQDPAIVGEATLSRPGSDGTVPAVRSRLPELAGFVDRISLALRSGRLDSEEQLARRCSAFFTDGRTSEIDGVLPGWRAMASYQDGKTQCHTVLALAALLDLEEFAAASPRQRRMMEWAVLLHDVAKEPPPGGRDHRHPFRSAARAGAILPALGFPVRDAWAAEFENWRRLADSAHRFDPALGAQVQDHERLPELMAGIERLFGREAALILKAIALHQSITVVQEWPAPVTLTAAEERAYLEPDLLPILGVVFLADSGGWNFFDRAALRALYAETREVMTRLAAR